MDNIHVRDRAGTTSWDRDKMQGKCGRRMGWCTQARTFSNPESLSRRTAQSRATLVSALVRQSSRHRLLMRSPQGRAFHPQRGGSQAEMTVPGFTKGTHGFQSRVWSLLSLLTFWKGYLRAFASDARHWFVVRPKAKIQGGAEIRKSKHVYWKKMCSFDNGKIKPLGKPGKKLR